MNTFTIRFAMKEDSPLIVQYIRDLADYENELDQVSATPELLNTYMFDKNGAEAIIGEYDGKPVGFAMFHATFSTFLGKPGLGLIDLYIEPEYRSKGFGKAMLQYLAKITRERDCSRLEWWCHDWNENAIRLYKKWGAVMVPDIRVYRLAGAALDLFAAE